MVPWAHVSPHPEKHLDRFIRFGITRCYCQQTRTDHTRSAAIDRISLHYVHATRLEIVELLTSLLPPVKNNPYWLRSRYHNFQLPVCNNFSRKSFIMRCLFRKLLWFEITKC